MPLDSADVLSVGEAAELCGVSLETIRRWIRKGSLRAYNTGGTRNIRILRWDFDEFVEHNNILTTEVLAARQSTGEGGSAGEPVRD